mgnify:CR=1 FL=1
MTFIDDFSQKLWASVLKSKDQVLSVFKEFQARAERETDTVDELWHKRLCHRLCRKEANVSANTVDELWHKMLCHMSEKGMRKVAVDDLILELKNVHLNKCANWLGGKQNRTSFRSKPPMRKKVSLELVHTDVCYVDIKSHVGSQYFMKFIDDYSRKLWASVLKTKDLVLSVGDKAVNVEDQITFCVMKNLRMRESKRDTHTHTHTHTQAQRI